MIHWPPPKNTTSPISIQWVVHFICFTSPFVWIIRMSRLCVLTSYQCCAQQNQNSKHFPPIFLVCVVDFFTITNNYDEFALVCNSFDPFRINTSCTISSSFGVWFYFEGRQSTAAPSVSRSGNCVIEPAREGATHLNHWNWMSPVAEMNLFAKLNIDEWRTLRLFNCYETIDSSKTQSLN